MFKEFGIPRSLLIYGLTLPVAVVVGYLLATPTDFTSFAGIGMLVALLVVPLLLRWHHLLLIFGWNSTVIVFFLPGQPGLGVFLAFLSLGITVLSRSLNKKIESVRVPSVTWPLVLLLVVTLVTAQATGGIGARVLGAETWGAKRYLGVFGAIAGFFALTAQSIPRSRALTYASVYFLSGATSIISDLAYMLGPPFYFLYLIFSSEQAMSQAFTADTLYRLTGVAFAGLAGYLYLLMRYGITGLLDITKPWRLGMLTLVMVGSLLGGYRSLLIIMILVFMAQFYFEGLFRSKFLPILSLATLLLGVLTVGFIDKMPLSVQRTMSFLPLEIDASARLDAMGTLDWRLQMWKTVVPEIPRYLLLGKGYAYSGTDYYLTGEAIRRGYFTSFEDTLISGNYHQGLLTVIIPFGIWGFLGFAWFCYGAWRVLYLNYLYGDPVLKRVNTFLLSLFVGRLVFYVFFYGQFDLDLMIFTGAVGLSLSLNGGVCSPSDLRKAQAPAT